MANTIVFKIPFSKKEEVMIILAPVIETARQSIAEAIKEGTPWWTMYRNESVEAFMKSAFSYQETESFMYYAGSIMWMTLLLPLEPLDVRDIDGIGVEGLSEGMLRYLNISENS